MREELLFSSESDEWATPDNLYDALNLEFGFTLDPCATPENAKCEKYFTISDSGLLKDWGDEVVFCNPPYSKISEWVTKCYGAAQLGATVVMLIPSRTETSYWHRHVMKGEIRFIKGRLKFSRSKNPAPFPSAVIVFRPNTYKLLSLCMKSRN